MTQVASWCPVSAFLRPAARRHPGAQSLGGYHRHSSCPAWNDEGAVAQFGEALAVALETQGDLWVLKGGDCAEGFSSRGRLCERRRRRVILLGRQEFRSCRQGESEIGRR